MRVPIRIKIFGLVMAFLVVLSGSFLKMSYDFFIADKVNGVQEIQTLQVSKTINEISSQIDFYKVKMRESAIRLLDTTRGGVEEVANGLLWVSVSDKAWTSQEFKDKALPLKSKVSDGVDVYTLEGALFFVLSDTLKISKGLDKFETLKIYSLLPIEKIIDEESLKQGLTHSIVVDFKSLRDSKDLKSSVLMGTDRVRRLFEWLVSYQGQEWVTRLGEGTQAMGSVVKSNKGDPALVMGWGPVSTGGDNNRFAVLSLVEFRAIRAGFRDFVTQLVVGGILILGLSVFAAMGLARHISSPIEDVVRATHILQTGDFDVKVDAKRRDEVGDLGRAFNHMGESLKQREEELQAAQGALVQNEKLAALGTLSAGIAHEVKNPLAGILGNAELAENGVAELEGEKKKKVLRYLDVIKKETKRTRGIIDGLMRFSRKENNQQVLFDLEVVLHETINLMEHSLNMANVTVHSRFDDNLMMVLGHANSCEQVFLNMVQNAQHAMPDGGRIDIYTDYVNDPKDAKVGEYVAMKHPEFDGPFCRVRVQDTGSGMTRDVMMKIFEPFFTTKASGSGTGLGLSVTMNILNEHKARVSIDSEPGEGTVFYMDFMAKAKRDPETLEKLREVQTRKAGGDPFAENSNIDPNEESSENFEESGLTLGEEIDSGALKEGASAEAKTLVASKSKQEKPEESKVTNSGIEQTGSFTMRRPK